MSSNLFLPAPSKFEDKPLARIIQVNIRPGQRTKSGTPITKEKEKQIKLFYSAPIFKANKYEFL